MKRAIKRAPLPKVKSLSENSKILCPVHNSFMKFSQVTNKWKCEVENCKITANPVVDEDSKSVRLGKGSVSLKIIGDEAYESDEVRLILISDDNVALDVTDFVDKNPLFLELAGHYREHSDGSDIAYNFYHKGSLSIKIAFDGSSIINSPKVLQAIFSV